MSTAIEFIQSTYFIDSDDERIVGYSQDIIGSETDPVKQAIALYYAVRDGFRYDPYDISLSPDAFKASNILALGKGWCVAKAILLAACCRSIGIPSRLGFADVSNHLSTERMRQVMQTDVFYWHGYTSIFLNNNWVKATPAFNIELCDKFNLKPLEFDGTKDSIYHEFDEMGNKHMEYLNDRGEYSDLPLEALIETFAEYYPNMAALASNADFDQDIASETI
jgi:transglutaminase-like putative cysteine protease